MYFFATLASVSLLLLLTGTTVLCKPIQARSADVEQPTRCGTARPRTPSPSNCETTKDRRYFFHESHVKGCKLFGLCRTDSATLDATLAEGTLNYFLDFESCQKECMTHIQCPELSLSDNSNARVFSTNGLTGWGGKIVYECNAGYSFPQNAVRYTRMCQKNGSWSEEEPKCLKQCPSPDAISNGNFAPAKDLYNYGGNVHYTCSVGYKLVGNSMRACGDGGEWDGPEPNCTCAFPLVDGKCPPLCPEPSLIDNGDINAPEGARIHGGTSHYSCREGYTLIGNSSHTCYNGSWLGKEPTCWKVVISMTSKNSTRDVTNSSVTLAKGSKGIVFEVIPTPRDLFDDKEIKWDFMGANDRTEIPHGLMVEKLRITFNTILNTEEQEGNYTITFGDYRASFTLEVDAATVVVASVIPHFLTVNQNPNKYVSVGSSVLLPCISEGTPVPTIGWRHNNEPIAVAEGSQYSIMKGSSLSVAFSGLSIQGITDSNLGEYRCVASNSAGSNSTLVSRLILSGKRKRSVDQQSVQTNSLCHQQSADTVTILGRVKKIPIPGQVPTYSVHIKKVLRSPSSSKASQMLQKTKTILVVAWSSSPLDYREETLRVSTDYVFQGQLISGQFLLASPSSIHRHTPAIRQQLAAC